MQHEKEIACYQPRSVRRPRIAKDARESERAHPQGGSEANDGEAVAQASACATLFAGGVLFFGLNSSRAMTRRRGSAGSDAPVSGRVGWVTTGCLKHNPLPLPYHPAERVKRDAANDAATRSGRAEAAVVSMTSSFWFSHGRTRQCVSIVSVASRVAGKVRAPGNFGGKRAMRKRG
jgi:hypothetical protein